MGAFRKESHAHRGRCAGSRTARDIAQTPSEMVLSRVWKANKIIPLIEENRKVWYDAQRRTTE